MPPYTASERRPQYLPSASASLQIWMTSSRVGAITRAAGNAAVFLAGLGAAQVARQNRHKEGRRLAGSGLRPAGHVLAGQGVLEAQRLDRRAVLEAQVSHRVQDLSGQVEIVEPPLASAGSTWYWSAVRRHVPRGGGSSPPPPQRPRGVASRDRSWRARRRRARSAAGGRRADARRAVPQRWPPAGGALRDGRPGLGGAACPRTLSGTPDGRPRRRERLCGGLRALFGAMPGPGFPDFEAGARPWPRGGRADEDGAPSWRAPMNRPTGFRPMFCPAGDLRAS
jgi:hypothetical protein